MGGTGEERREQERTMVERVYERGRIWRSQMTYIVGADNKANQEMMKGKMTSIIMH